MLYVHEPSGLEFVYEIAKWSLVDSWSSLYIFVGFKTLHYDQPHSQAK